jgi:hypothetical protein
MIPGSVAAAFPQAWQEVTKDLADAVLSIPSHHFYPLAQMPEVEV